jgi:hypothetical protein
MHKNCDHPAGPLLYTISCLHCMSVSLAQDGAGLGAMWGQEQALKMLHAAGFADVRVERLAHDFQNSYFIASKIPAASGAGSRQAAAREAEPLPIAATT